MWKNNKDIIKWVIGFAISAAIGWGSAKVKLETLQTEIDELKKNNEQITQLRIKCAELQTNLDAFKESNKQEHRQFKRK